LSLFQKSSKPIGAPAINWPIYNLRNPDELDFLAELNFLLQFCSPNASERDMLVRFTEIGVGAGLRFRREMLPLKLQLRLLRGVKRAKSEIDGALNQITTSTDLFDPYTSLHRNHLTRAAAARVGLYGASETEAFYLPRHRHGIHL